MFYNKVGNMFCCVAVAKGIGGMRHVIVGVGVGEQMGYGFHDGVFVGTDETCCAGLYSLWPLRGVAHHQHGLTESRGLLLNATTVGEYQRTLLHHGYKFQIRQWLQQVYVAPTAVNDFPYWTADIGIEVDVVDEVHIPELLGQCVDGLADMFHAVAKVLAAVTGDEHHAAMLVTAELRRLRLARRHHPM